MSDHSLDSLLTSLGFVAEGRQTWTLWRLGAASSAAAPAPSSAAAPAPSSAAAPAPSSTAAAAATTTTAAAPEGRPAPGRGVRQRLANPWAVAELELAERKSGIALHRLTMTLDQKVLTANLAALVRKYFTARAEASFVYETSGSVWCVFEFTRPGTRERARGNAQTAAGALVPQGVGGFNVRLMADGGVASVVLSGVFGVGYLPANFVSAPLRYVAEALALKPLEAVYGAPLRGSSVNELRFKLVAPALLHLAQRGAAPAALTALTAALAKARGSVGTAVLAGPAGLHVAVPGDVEPCGRGLVEVAYAPLEVLESREREERYRELDQTILSGKLGRGLRLAGERLALDPDSLYLMRRTALLGIAGRRERPATFLARALELEPDNKLFLSYAANLALEDGDAGAVLAHLSRLGGLLMGQIAGADGLSPFDVVLPELLGDAWGVEDPQKAAECYHRIIQRRGDLPRVLRKLIALARAGGRAEQEGAYLGRLLGVERRHGETSRLLVRLAELRRVHPTGKDEAVQLALKALKLDRGHHEAALLAAELLVEKGRCEEAIQLLDSLLKDAHLSLPAKAKSRLEEMVGRIWFRHLRRPDLAETRFEEALRHDGACGPALLELEAIYRLGPNLPALAGILELQFDVYAALGDGVTLTRIFDELVPLYRGVLAQPKRAYDLYQRLLAAAATSPLSIERVLDWRDVEIDWHDLYAKLSAQLAKVAAGEKRGQFLCRLAEICREKLQDHGQATAHLRAALDEGWIDGNSFLTLIETLGRDKDYTALAAAYERRLTQVPPGEQRRLLVELLGMPNGLAEGRRDALALNAYVLDPAADRTLRQRFHAYQALGDVPGLERLLQALLADKRLTGGQHLDWLRFAVEVLDGVGDDGRYALLDGVFRRLLDAAEDRVATLQEAIAALAGAPDPRRLVHYVAELLGAGLVPALEERQVVTLLSGLDHELALYHQLMSFKASQAEVAAAHARTAAALYGKRANQELNTEKMLARLATLVPCAEADLAELRGLVARTGNWVLLAKALQRQADFEDTRQRKYVLLEQLGVLYWKKLRDHARARLTFVLAMKHAAEPHKLKLVLAAVAAEAGDAGHERKALVDFLTDPAAPLDTKAMTRAVERLLRLGEEASGAARLVTPRLDHAAAAGNWELAGRLAAVLLDNKITSTELYKTAFKAALLADAADRAVDCWWRGLACVSNKSKAKTFMAETRKILDGEDRSGLLLACYKAALDNNIGDRLGPKIQHELLLSYGGMLFDADTKRRKALDVYQEVYAAEPDDNRTWMPLYFLLLEFGAPAERLAHLREILPRLDQDPRPLKAFPLTIESLQVELVELVQQLGPAAAAAVPARRSPRAPAAALPPPPPPRPPEAASPDDADASGAALAAAEEPEGLAGLVAEDFGAPAALVAGEGPGFGLAPPPAGRSPASARALSVVGAAPAASPMPAARGTGSATAAPPVQFKLGIAPAPLARGGVDAGRPQAGEPEPLAAAGTGWEPALPPEDVVVWVPGAASAPSEPDASADGAADVHIIDLGDLGGGDGPDAPAPRAELGDLAVPERQPEDVAFAMPPAGGWDAAAAGAPNGGRWRDDEAPPQPAPPGGEPAGGVAAGYAPESSAADVGPTEFGTFDLGVASGPGAGAAAAPEFPVSAAAPQSDYGGGGTLVLDGDLGDAMPLFVPGAGAPPGPAAAPAGESWDLASPTLAGTPAAAEWLPLGGADAAPPLELGQGAPLAMDLGPAAAAAAEAGLPPLTLGDAPEPGPAAPDGHPGSPGQFRFDTVAGGLPPVPVPSAGLPDGPADGGGSGLGTSFELGAFNLGGDGGEVSSVELAAAIAAPDDRPGDDGGGLPPPPGSSSGGSDAKHGAGGEPPRFGGTQSSQLTSQGTSAGEATNVVSSGEVVYGSSAVEAGDDVGDWRAAAIKGDFNADLTAALLKQAFASELEKHLAIQCVALVAGNCDRLSHWHWRVWRDAKEYGYPLIGKDRFPAAGNSPLLQSTLHKFVLTAAPVIVRRFRARFTVEHVARRMEMSPAAVEKLRKPMNWGEGLLKEAGFHLYADRINQRRYYAFNLPGLGREIFYDGVTRGLYLDEAYYRKAPTSHLFHRVLGLLWSVRIHYFVPLAIHPLKDFQPLLGELNQFFGAAGFSAIKSRLTGGSAIAKHLHGMDTRLLKSLHAKIGSPSDEQLAQLWDAMRMHLYRLLVAETLDVIGTFEALLDRDLLKSQALKHSEIYQLSPVAKALMEFVTKLKI